MKDKAIDYGILARKFTLEVYVDRFSQSPNLSAPFSDAATAIMEGRKHYGQGAHTVVVREHREVNGHNSFAAIWRKKDGREWEGNIDREPYLFRAEDLGEMISDPAILEPILGFELPKGELIPGCYTITSEEEHGR